MEKNRNDKTAKITLRVPDKYKEYDESTVSLPYNIYEDRFYVMDYDDEIEKYGYKVHYEITTLDAEQFAETINSSYISDTYGEANPLRYSGDLTLNDKEFKVYDGGVTDIGGIMLSNNNRIKYYVNKKILFYELQNDLLLCIQIDGNRKDITSDIVNELVDFTVDYKDIK